ncbi:carbonic anhydrase family protein [Sinirhodobacter populi]|uniref:carbonic anhydrase n=1 Tax=Paenirhodobacter populi TaxID=2306993 RepID=A0A443KM18_9RHOB|nr:carbonic anhydrase family protein [Sinirhodobacter populi]RWR33882.1 carbonic anhydrase family protein [Sinirhodobacter populi]
MRSHRFLIPFAALMAVAGPVSAEETTAPHWSYTGEADPEHWGELAEAWHACTDGSLQSPIDIEDAAAVDADLPDLEVAYTPFPLTIVNNGHSLQVAGAPDNGFDIEGHHFDLVQFHFHTPAEYHVNGKTYPLELHLVHQRDDGALAVVSVMFDEGAENPALEQVFAHIPATVGETVTDPDVLVDVAGLLPQDHRYYRLMGSLTTPPCSEGVNWYVMEEPMQASKAQIETFARLFPEGDARPLQSANNRLVVRDVK